MMTELNPQDQPIDPQLFELLEQLRETPARDPEAVANGRAKFLAEVESISPAPLKHRKSRLGWFSRNHHQTEDIPVNRTQRFAFSVFIVIVLGIVFLLGGAGATVYAAQSALPGDALYPVKTGLEQTRLTLAGDAYRQAQLHLEFAQLRLDEIAGLIAEGRFQDVRQATEDFQADLTKAIAAFQVVAKNDPGRSGELALQIATALSRYTQVLSTMASSVPEAVKPEVEKALHAALNTHEVEFTGQVETVSDSAWTIGGQTVIITPETDIRGAIEAGDWVEVRSLLGPDNSLVALWIDLEDQPASGNDNQNDNANLNENVNANQNANDNGNDNANENQNGNENGNINANDNGNENINSNVNSNENQNGNTNGNLNGNANGNVNGNVNDDGTENNNDNLNTNDNGNENEDDSNASGNDNANDNQNNNDSNSNGNDNTNQNDNDGAGGGNDNDNENGSGSGGGGYNGNGDD